MRSILTGVISFFSIQLLCNCYYDNEEALYGVEVCSEETATYSGSVSAIIENNCLVCHSQSENSGGITLETHAQVKAHAERGALLGAVSHSGGFSPMPKNAPKLSDCDISAIRMWIEGGAQNN
jgi:uncharacterized membrane protein